MSVRASSVAPSSSITEAVTCSTTSAWRARCRGRAALPRVASARLAVLARESRSTGSSPQTTPATAAQTARTTTALRSSANSPARGRFTGRSATTARTPAAAMPTPARPPAIASTPCSTASWRTSRPRLAPSAARTAMSWRRASAPIITRPATLAEASSNISSTAATSRAIAPRTLPVTRSPTGTAERCRPPSPWSTTNPACTQRLAITASSLVASAGARPARQPRHADVAPVAPCPEVGGVPDQHGPQLGGSIAAVVERQLERRRHDADHRARPPVELHGAANHAGIAGEAALPQAMPEDHRARRRRPRRRRPRRCGRRAPARAGCRRARG